MSVSEAVYYGEDTAQWLDAIHDARAEPVQRVEAQTFGRDLPGHSSRPVLLTCDDGRDYVVKGIHAGRMPVNDQVVGRLGRSMNAPIPRVVLVDLPEELIQMQPEMAHMSRGLAHGSEVLPSVVDSYLIEHIRKGDGNRGRFARLAVLWGVVGVFDKQYLYSDDDAPRVYSADHGHAFPGGPDWTRRSLTRPRSPALPDPEVVDKCQLTDMEIVDAAKKLSGIDDAQIARIVAAPPDGWGFDMPDRVALAQFISRRRREMLRALNINL